MAAHVLHVALKGIIAGPENDADVALLAVADELLEVDVVDHLHEVGLQIDGPAFVENDILNAVFRGKIDISLVGIIVHARQEIHPVEVPVVPPVPGHLSRLNPRKVLQAGGLGQQVAQVGSGQRAVLFRHNGHTPGETARSPDTGDVILTVAHEHLQPVVPALIQFLGIAGLHTRELPLAAGGEIKAGIIVEVGLGDAHLDIRGGLHHQRQEHQPLPVEAGNRGRYVFVLKRIVELRVVVAVLAAVDIGHRGHGVAGKTVFHLFTHNAERLLVVADQAIGNAVVIGTEHHAVVALEAQRQLVVMVAEFLGPVEGCRHKGIAGTHRLLRKAEIPAPHLPVVQLRRNRRGLQNQFVIERNAVSQTVAHRYTGRQPAVGRGYLKLFLRIG